jgi:NADH dehydrogenase
MLATIGRGAAVAKIGRIKARGFIAWLLWLCVHIVFLIGFRNRAVVLLQWAWSYVAFDRGARLITEPLKEPLVIGSDPARRDEVCTGDFLRGTPPTRSERE